MPFDEGARKRWVVSDIGDYADVDDIKDLLSKNCAPYVSRGVVYHLYKIEATITAS